MSGAVAVFATDEQNGEAIDLDRWRDLAHHALVDSGVGDDCELNLLFVDEEAMAELNVRFMDEIGPTDVLSFPIEPVVVDHDGGDGPGPRLLGDVVICPSVARRNSGRHNRRFGDELALLVVHGVLHVLGLDHAEPVQAATMRARERQLLAGWVR